MSEAIDEPERLDRRQWVEPELPRARVDAGFQGLLAKEAEANTSARAVIMSASFVTVAAAVALFVFVSGNDDASPFAGTELTTYAEPTTVSLADGSTIEAQPHTSLSLIAGDSDRVAFALNRGAATFEVTPNPDRDFVVEAGDVVVRVVGTRFTVVAQADPDRSVVEVSVERGIVEVETGGEVRRLTAGQRWERAETAIPLSSAREAADETLSEEDPNRAARRRPRAATAEHLFEQASVARAEGRHADAAAAYERLIASHRRDRRAALAALALGRLRIDRLGDPAGAAEAFTTALRLAPRSPLREDTLARLVRAHEAAGAAGACNRARDRYLERYPEGRHHADIRGRCGR